MSIARFVRVSALAMMAILIVGGLLAAWRLDRIRMGGAVQVAQQQNAELIADILPPPEYVIEPYLEASLLLFSPEDGAKVHLDKLQALRKSYLERAEFWRASNLDSKLKTLLLEGSHPPAERFWNELEAKFLPAIAAGDRSAALASYARLREQYVAHRAAVDKLVAAASERNDALEREGRWEFALGIGIVIVLALIVAAQALHFYLTMAYRVINPVSVLAKTTDTLAQGGHAEVPFRDRADEIASIAIGLEHFRSSAARRAEADAYHMAEQQQVTDALAKALLAMRDGDLTQLITDDFPASYAILKQNSNDAVGALRDMIQLISESADGIREGSEEIARVTRDLAQRTEGSASSVAQANESLQEIEARLKASMVRADDTVLRADTAKDAVCGGRSTADHAVQAMARVRESARSIDDVIEGLDKIAFQTRVLAMNAAVEAGRAGEAGRGFAVVADLVSALAMRSEEEAKTARDLLTGTQADIGQAAAAVQETDAALLRISDGVEAVHSLLEAMRDDQHAQSAAVTAVAGAMQSLDGATRENAQMVQQTSAATRHLSTELAALADRAAAFRFERRHRSDPVANDRRVALRVNAGAIIDATLPRSPAGPLH
ncbi:MAG: methyl-accepting chemotaxis protein [Pseudomonadota bacterium]